jgi:Phage Mu protein F like protein
MAIKAAFNQPFQEQVDFFRQKINLPSERWDDIFKSAHDRGFIVAGATKADLLDSFRSAVDQTKEQGKSLKWFQNEFDRVVEQHGWTGWTGEGSKKGRDWRSRLIYQQNMLSSYAAGRQTQLDDPDLLLLRPYRTYVHADGVRHPRLMHQSWNGITLPADDVFWDSHTAPNGWLCHCRVESASARDYHAAQSNGKAVKPDGWDKVDPKTGEYVGIDKGFGYKPGANVNKPLSQFIDDKLIKLDAPIGAALFESLKPYLVKEQFAKYQAMVSEATTAGYRVKNTGVMAHVLTSATVIHMAELGQPLQTAAIYMVDGELIHALRDAKTARGAALPIDIWLNLPKYLEAADIYYDTQDPALVFAIDADGVAGKVVVRVNYAKKIRLSGERENLKANFITTGGLLTDSDIKSVLRYSKLKK